MTNRYSRTAFDTNVLISSFLLPSSVPAAALKAAQSNGVVLASEEAIAELEEVLFRAKFDSRLSRAAREYAFIGFLTTIEQINVMERVQVCRDPRDDKFLSLAISGNADALVSGDEDLLILHPFHDIDIITPHAYLVAQTEGSRKDSGL